jgi:ABC-type antimicrobial peptide transport system permease subunit
MKKILFLLVFLLIGSNLFWLYIIIDQAVTKSYHDQVASEFANTIIQTTTLLDYYIKDKSTEQLSEVMKKVFKNDSYFKDADPDEETEASLNSSKVSIEVKNGKATKILVDDLVTQWAKHSSDN